MYSNTVYLQYSNLKDYQWVRCTHNTLAQGSSKDCTTFGLERFRALSGSSVFGYHSLWHFMISWTPSKFWVSLSTSTYSTAKSSKRCPCRDNVFLWQHVWFGFLVFSNLLFSIPKDVWKVFLLDLAGFWRTITFRDKHPVTTAMAPLIELRTRQLQHQNPRVQVVQHGWSRLHSWESSQKVVLLKMIEVSMVKLFVTFTSGIHCHEIVSCIGLPYRQVDSDVDHCNCLLFLCPQSCRVSGVWSFFGVKTVLYMNMHFILLLISP